MEQPSVFITAIITGLAVAGANGAVLFFLLKNTVGIKFCDTRHNLEAQQTVHNQKINHEEHRKIRKGLAFLIAKVYGKEHKIPELAGKDASMIVEAITEDLNGDE